MYSDSMLSAFRFYRLKGCTACRALELARKDVAAGTPRYTSAPAYYPAVSWQDGKPGLGHVATPDNAGLRYVGAVDTDSRGGPWCRNEGESGYCTDPYGDYSRDGSGLVWGVVYQLSGRSGQARFVAGYQFGGTDGGPTLDFGTIYESADSTYWDGPRDMDAARQAARVADSMAEHAGEEERAYQTAWAAGNAYASELEQAATMRGELKALLVERRAMKSRIGDWPAPVLCRTIESAARDLGRAIARAKARAIKAARGDLEPLYFYPDDNAKAAFCEAAGLTLDQFNAI